MKNRAGDSLKLLLQMQLASVQEDVDILL